MRKWIGTICIILGVACLLAAVGFVIYNRWEAENAADITQSLLQDVQLVIDENKTIYTALPHYVYDKNNKKERTF